MADAALPGGPEWWLNNWCEVVVDAVEERLNVDGFRFGKEPEADSDAWDIWQRNQLDAGARRLGRIILREADG